MRYLICGDLHTHFNILKRVEELSKDYDKVVFLGDYVDDWNAIPEASYNTVKELIDFKLANPDKVVPLLGNHCLSEWLNQPFLCSGYNHLTHNLVKPLFDEYESLFNIAYVPDGIEAMFSHAGLTKSWWDEYCSEVPHEEELKAGNYADALNWAFHHRRDDIQAEEIFQAFSNAGYARGGHGNPSPTWADLNELIADAIPNLTQIVGHTPIHTITHYLLNEDTDFYACDTHSTDRTGSPIGDSSLLTIDDGNYIKIDLDGHQIPW